MLRVCHIASGDLWAGAEVMTYTLLKSLRAYADLRIAVILLNQGKLADELRTIGIEVQIFEENRFSFPVLLLKTKKFVDQFSPDIIHSHRFKENILSYLVSRTRKKRRLVVTQHGMPEPGKTKPSYKSHLLEHFHQKILRQYIDKHVVVSNDILSQIRCLDGFDNHRTEVIHNGIDVPPLKMPSNPPEMMIIGSAGRFVPVKDYSFMVDIAGHVKAMGLPISFRLAGNGPESSFIQKKIVENGLEDFVKLDGHVDDISDFYRGLDVFINTSLHEGIPMSILEAMAHGIPVIAPDVGGIGEIIENGKDGFLIKERSLSDFSENCIKLQKDIKIRKKMGQAARGKILNKFSAAKMADKYLNLYLDCTNTQLKVK